MPGLVLMTWDFWKLRAQGTQIRMQKEWHQSSRLWDIRIVRANGSFVCLLTHFPENIWRPCSYGSLYLRFWIFDDVFWIYWSAATAQRPIDPPAISHFVRQDLNERSQKCNCWYGIFKPCCENTWKIILPKPRWAKPLARLSLLCRQDKILKAGALNSTTTFFNNNQLRFSATYIELDLSMRW